MKAFAIRNATVFTVNAGNRVIANGTVLVMDDRIVDVGPDGRVVLPEACTVIDGTGKAVLPGLIDSHSHSSLMRGVTENKALMQWLPWYQLEHRALTEDDAYHAARLCYLEALQNGTTCVMDMYRFMDRCADAAGELGLRVQLAPYVADLPGKDFFATRAENKRLIETHHNTQQGRIRVWMGLEHLLYCSADAYREAALFQREYGVGIHTHASEQKAEEQAVTDALGQRSLAMLDHYGVLGENTLLAHCVWLNDDEIKRVADTGTAIAHCPVSNAKLASGVARVPELLAAGIRVGIGTDGPVCNNSLNLFEEMKFASLIQKATRLDATALPAQHMLRMATIEGARALNLDHDIGSLEPGKKADLLLLDVDTANLAPVAVDDDGGSLLWNLVFAAGPANVDRVWVDGRLVLSGGAPVTVSGTAIVKASQKAGLSLQARCRELAHTRIEMR